jgi:alkylation response protein AidB-like acyl-CoA dehydrogenase
MTAGFDLGLSPAQAELQQRLHAVAGDELRSAAAQTESEGLDVKLLAQLLGDVGLAPATLLQEGVQDPHTLLVAIEEVAYGDADTAWAAVPAFQIATVLDSCGSSAQRTTASRALAPVDATSSVLLYEDFGRQPSEYGTGVTATPDGASITGAKRSVAHPAGADISLLVAREGSDLAAFCFTGPRGALIAERDDREVGKIALTAVPSGPVTVSGLTTTAEERLAGGVALHRAVGQARLLLAACLVGVARASLEFASAYALQRTTWGTPLSEHQGVSFSLIEQTTELYEVRLLLWDVADQLRRLEDVEKIERAVTRAVNRASSLGLRATRSGVQLVGVRGITRDLPCERWYRAAAALAAIDFDILQTPFGLN